MFAFTSDPEDIVGRGRSDVLTLQNATFRADLSRDGGRLAVVMQRTDVPPTDNRIVTTLIISMPSRGPIAPGSYETTLGGDATHAGLYVANGLSCAESTGHLVIHTVEFAPAFAALKELRASFDQRCTGAVAGLRGEIALLADPWR